MLIKIARFALMLTILLLLSCTKGLLRPTREAPKRSLGLAPTISFGILKNGLAYYHKPSGTGEKSCSLRLNIKGGSLVEGSDELGMAHLIQHLALDAPRFVNGISLKEWFINNGMPFGPDINASSNVDHTVYKIDLSDCTRAKIKEALAIFRNFADGLQFSNTKLERELINIDEEEHSSKNPSKELNEQINKILYSGALFIKRPVWGLKNIREKINTNMLKRFYQKNYDPKNLTVVVVGDTYEATASMIENTFSDLKSRSSAAVYDPGEPIHKEPSFVVHHPHMNQVEVNYVIQPTKFMKPSFSSSILKERLSYNLALSMLKNSLAQLDNHHKSIFRETTLSGSMLDKNNYELNLSISAAKESFEKNFTESLALIRDAAEKGFDENEFNLFRMMLIQSLDQAGALQENWKPAFWAQFLIEYINNDKLAYSAADYRDRARPILEKLSPKDCQKALGAALKSGREIIYSVGGLLKTQENILALEKLLTQAKKEKLSINLKKPLSFAYESSSCHSTPHALEHVQSIDAFHAKLADNLQVLMKATKLNQDEVLISVFNDEGLGTMTDQEYAQARMAQMVWLEGGLKKHPPEEVERLWNGRVSSFRLNILPTRLQTTIVTRKEHLRFALEIISAYLYDPLYADKVLALTKEKIKLSYEGSKRDMWAPLHHDFPRTLSADDHRVGHSKLEDLLAISRDDLLAWHHQFIASRKVNIVVVGDFNPQDLSQEISCVIKPALANIKLFETTKKPKLLSFKSGIHKVYNISAKKQPSKLVIRYPMNFPESVYPDHRWSILQNIIEESLREQNPPKITPVVKATISNNKFTKNYMDIIFSVPKNQADKTLNNTKRKLEKLAAQGVSGNKFKSIKENYLKQITKTPEENIYWLLSLSENFNDIKRLQPIDKIAQSIGALDTKEINSLLHKYFRESFASSAIVNIKEP